MADLGHVQVRTGTVTSVDTTTGLCGVTVDGTALTALAVGWLPAIGDTVNIEQRGQYGQDWVIYSIQAPTAVGRTFSRYKFNRTANGVASGGFVDIGLPDTTPWSTGSTASNHSIITMTRDAFVSVYCAWQGQFGMMITTYGLSAGGVAPYTQSASIYQTMLGFSSLMLSGETIDFIARNHNPSLDNLTCRTAVTYSDAQWLVAET